MTAITVTMMMIMMRVQVMKRKMRKRQIRKRKMRKRGVTVTSAPTAVHNVGWEMHSNNDDYDWFGELVL